jgi:hypothetical protein
MPGHAQYQQNSRAKMTAGCNAQRSQCISQNIGNPNPQRAHNLQKCQTTHNSCMATTNKFFPTPSKDTQ